jgi:hypothetical protein
LPYLAGRGECIETFAMLMWHQFMGVGERDVMSFNPDLNVLKRNLDHWFNFDHLSPAQGIAILIGIEPVEESLNALNNWYGDDRYTDDLEFIRSGIPLLNGDIIGGAENKQFIERHGDKDYSHGYTYGRAISDEKTRFHAFVTQYHQLLQYWNSGKHPEITPLLYFIELALSKNIPPEWLDRAIEFGIYAPEQEKTPDVNSVEKPISPNERNTLLTIIAALCDHSAIKFEEHGAATEIARMTDKIGAHVSDDAIRAALKKIPDAVERRKK